MKLSFTIKNTGKTDGAEIVQVYVSQPKASVLRPAKELKAFAKVNLKAGETQNVELEVKVQDIGFYAENSKSWVVEPGAFVFQLASSYVNITSKFAVHVK